VSGSTRMPRFAASRHRRSKSAFVPKCGSMCFQSAVSYLWLLAAVNIGVMYSVFAPTDLM